MPNSKPCRVCSLGEDVCKEVARRTTIGMTAADIVGYLGEQGHKVTQRDIFNHNRHIQDLSPQAIAPFVQTAPERPARPLISEEGISDREREERLLAGFLAVTERLLFDFEATGNIKIARAAAEVGKITSALLNAKMDREPEVERQLVLNIVRKEAKPEP